MAEERERRQIAGFLHDRVGQNLALAKLRLRVLATAQPSVGGALDEVSQLLDEVIADTRSLTADLGSPVLYELGLQEALTNLVRRFAETHGIPARSVDDGRDKPLGERQRLVVYQAVRELLHNIVKHANASSVVVSCRRSGQLLEVTVTDRGTGFDSERTPFHVTTGGGFGLFNIRERVLHLGGTFAVDSKPGHGTTVTLAVPLAAQGTRTSP